MIAGAVLTGGASRRMGRTKALIEFDGTPMAAHVAAALDDVGCSPVVLMGGDADELAVLGRVVVADPHPGEGPLGAIVAMLERFADDPDIERVLIVACDLPMLTVDDLDQLIRAGGAHPEVDVAVASSGRHEPACALWLVSAAPRLRAIFDAGERAVHRALGRIDHVTVTLPIESLRNINTPDDLDRYS
jgi:molybdenum cofactor guanylyltransferase